jgi:hypothetical protein
MSLLDPDTTPLQEARLGRWFVFGGLVGFAVGLMILFIPHLADSLGNGVLVAFPSSILGIGDPRTAKDVAITALMEFSFQFILYGTVGLLLGFCIHLARKLTHPLQKRSN